MPDDHLQWKVWIVPNYDQKTTMLIWKSQHVVADGIGVLCMLGCLEDKYDPSNYIQTSSVLPFWKKFIIFLIKPFTAAYALLWFAMWSPDSNCIKPKGEIQLDAYKKNAICKPMNIALMKKMTKKFGSATINDLVMGMAAVAIKKYMI